MQLYRDVTSKWTLDVVSLRLLRHACESLQQANVAAHLVETEGACIHTSKGVIVHPAARLEKDHRCASANTLQKLLLSLESVAILMLFW